MILVLKTPVNSWGFSLERAENYLKRAEELNLDEHPQWIKLGHYKKNILALKSVYKSGFTEGFFISKKGRASPSEELKATIQLLYSAAEDYTTKNKEHPQCYYLARTRWLNHILQVSPEDQMSCPERTSWKKDLNAQSVSLIFAAGDMSNAASTFGHTFLKINNPANQGQKDLLNYGIDYSADADASEGFFYAVKGLFGFYNGHFAMLPFHQKILEYTNVEGRDIWEYQLNFTKDETDFLIDHLLEMEKARAPYYFADENCSTQILRTLEAVRPELNLADQIKGFVVPIETVKLIHRSPGLVEKVIYKPALKTEFIRAYDQLDVQQKDYFPSLVKNLNFSEQNNFSNKQKAQLLETAAWQLSLEAFRKNINLEDQKYQLYLQRTELGPGAATTESSKNILSPSESHDSFGVTYGLFDGGALFKLRGAFHELEQPHEGLIPHSHIEAISVSFKAKESKGTFDRFTLLKLINLNPSNSLETNLAWKVRAELLESFRPDLEGGLGASLALTKGDELRFSALLSARYWNQKYIQSSEILIGEWSAAGPELLFSFHPVNRLGISFSGTYFLVNRHNDYLRTILRMNWNFTQSYGFQWYYENLIEPDAFTGTAFENKISITGNFIF